METESITGTEDISKEQLISMIHFLKGLYSYIIYWGMEDKRIAGDQLTELDKGCVNGILNRIVKDGRISMIEAENVKIQNR